MAWAATGVGMGGGCFLPITQLLLDHSGWRSTGVVMAVVLMALSIPRSAIFWRRQPEDMGLAVDGKRPVPARAGTTAPSGPATEETSWTVREAFRTATM